MRVKDSEITEQSQASNGWGIAVGIIMIILGIAAIARPLYATIASTIAFGWLFIVAGIVQIAYAFQSRGAGQVVWKVLLGILYLIGGFSLVYRPISGAIAFTLVLGVTIFFLSVIQVSMAFQMSPARGWAWVLASGILGIILGIFIWSNFPFSAAWVIGLWVGISFVLNGMWILTLSSLDRSVRR